MYRIHIIVFEMTPLFVYPMHVISIDDPCTRKYSWLRLHCGRIHSDGLMRKLMNGTVLIAKQSPLKEPEQDEAPWQAVRD